MPYKTFARPVPLTTNVEVAESDSGCEYRETEEGLDDHSLGLGPFSDSLARLPLAGGSPPKGGLVAGSTTTGIEVEPRRPL
jgi:hypothetical protein